jgi:dethiobiotin synthetase/adenosylmethionine--8-amino-7-oxononanoate aminotransferase
MQVMSILSFWLFRLLMGLGGAGYASHSAQTLLQSLRLPLDDGSTSAAPGGAPFGVHYRTLGNVAYFMSSLNTPRATIEALEDRLWRLVSGVRRS